MATIRLLLRKDKQKANGEAPIYLRITENRKSRFLNTGIGVEPKLWNDNTQRIRRSHPKHKRFNDELERLLHEAQTAALDLRASKKKALTAKAVKQELTGQGAGGFYAFAQRYIDNLDVEGKFWEWKKARVLREKLQDFHPDASLAFGEIDKTFLLRFEKYMREELKNKTNTVQKNLQILQRMLKQAIREEVITANDNPFLHYQIKSEKTRKDKLGIEDIRALEALDLEKGSALWHTRNFFLFSFYSAGVRFGDLCCLRWKNLVKRRLEYRMNKTGTPKSIKLVPQAKLVLDDYRCPTSQPNDFIFPLLRSDRDYSDPRFMRKHIASRNAVVNGNLKRLAELAGITINLSFHISRHSFADYARTQGMDLYSISKALAHSDLKTTEVYLKSFDTAAVDDAMGKLFG